MHGVWWPGSHVISSWWSLLAAGLSSLAIGATVLPATRRLDNVEDRVFRGVQAEPYSWPWIAKLKVRRVTPLKNNLNKIISCIDYLPEARSKSTEESLRRGSDC